MGWVYRKKDLHECVKPAHDYRMTVDDVWECDDCNRHWQITKIEFEDRPCGGVFVTWEAWSLTAPPIPTEWQIR